VIKLKQEQTW